MVEAVSKSLPVPDEFLKVLGIDRSAACGLATPIPFTPLEEIEAALVRAVTAVDVAELARKVVQTRLDQSARAGLMRSGIQPVFDTQSGHPRKSL